MFGTLRLAGILLPGIFVSAALAASLPPDPTASDYGTAIVAAAPAQGQVTPERAPLGAWTVVQSLNAARSRPAGAFFPGNGKFYVLGGEGVGGNRDLAIEEYDPAADTWTDRSTLNVGVSNAGAAQVGDYIYVPGGWTGSIGRSEMQRFDPVANTVTNTAPLPANNFAHAVAVQDGKIYVLGGNSSGNAGTTNFIYDVATDSWTTGAPVPVAVNYPAAVSDGTYIYLAGGRDGSDLTDVQRYDPATDTWTAVAPLTAARGGPGAFFDGDTVHVIGGGWYTYLDTTEDYDSAANTWSAGLPLNVAARTFATAFGDNMALKAGGWNGTYLDAVEILKFETCRPDAQIKTSGKYVGKGIYNTTGKKQTKRTRVFAGGYAVFRILLQNDGNAPDQLRVAGAGDLPGFHVKYFEGARKGKNITRRVKKGTYKTADLAAGESTVIRLVVKTDLPPFGYIKPYGNFRTWKVTVSSTQDPTLLDAVKAKVKLKRLSVTSAD